jgi:hypothetical protein
MQAAGVDRCFAFCSRQKAPPKAGRQSARKALLVKEVAIIPVTLRCAAGCAARAAPWGFRAFECCRCGADDIVGNKGLGNFLSRHSEGNSLLWFDRLLGFVCLKVKVGAKFLDATASTVATVLRQYPLWRLAVFAYVVFVHIFIYLLINRLQRRALNVELDAAEHLAGGHWRAHANDSLSRPRLL